MEDSQIVRLYFERSEDAISQTAAKYGSYLHSIAFHILNNREDSEECVNDTYWKAWDVIPPRRPAKLAAFLGKISRNLSLDRYRHYTAEKRGGSEFSAALDELGECIPSGNDPDDCLEKMILVDALNRFLSSLPSEHRIIFMRRYWYISTIKEIANDYGITESKVKMSLLRSRNQLKTVLEKEGIAL